MPALPGNPADPSFPALPSVTCPSRGGCFAVGYYEFSVEAPLVVEEQNGIWGSGSEAALPSNAATSRDPNYTNAGGSLSQVACVSEDECTAVGTYANEDQQYSDYGWFLTGIANPAHVGETQAASMARLPAGAAAVGDFERGTSPFFGFTGLSCLGGGSCTAVGGYVDTHDDEHGVIFTKTPGGGWGPGIKAPVPANAGLNTAQPNEFENPLASLSCARAGNCAATGWYLDRSRQRRGLLLTEAHGRWTARELVLPARAPRNALPILGQVACTSPGNCVAIGDYASGGKTYGLLVVERRGKWGRGIKAALPANASKASHVFLNAISCASATRCTVVGIARIAAARRAA